MAAAGIDGAAIVSAFKKNNFMFSGNELAEEAAAMCSRYSLNADRLAAEYEAIVLTKKLTNADTLNKQLLERLRSHLAKKERKASKTLSKGVNRFRSMKSGPMLNKASKIEPIPMQSIKTPSPSQKRALNTNAATDGGPTPKTAKLEHKKGIFSQHGKIKLKSTYHQRTNKGQILKTKYNPSMLVDQNDMERFSDARCQIEIMSTLKKPYQCMYTPPAVRAQQLEKALSSAASKLADMHKLGQYSPVGEPNQESVVCLGRICCDAEGDQGTALTAKSVWLEGSVDDNGARIELDISKLKSYSIFPGQILAAKGICADGKRMVVERLYTLSARAMPKSEPEQLMDFNHGQTFMAGKPIQMMVAAGPYCVVDDLEYTPLNDLFIEAKRRSPDVLVLLGPFVDENNSKIEYGDTQIGEDHYSFTELFQMQVVGQLDIFLADNPNARVIIAPSPSDAHHPPMYPQPPFDFSMFLEMTENPQRMERQVTLIPNPGMFKINEMVVGVTTTDVVRHMIGGDTTKVSEGRKGMPMHRLPAHMWNQGSFYPLFPADRSACLDLAQSEHFEMKVKPDIMICSSKLPASAAETEKVVLLNPGRLCLGAAGGTWARVCIHPMEEQQIQTARDNEEPLLAHDVYKRTGIEVIKI